MKKILIPLLLIPVMVAKAQPHSGNIADCPFHASTKTPAPSIGQANDNRDWWPNQLNLDVLRQNSSLSNPMGNDFNY